MIELVKHLNFEDLHLSGDEKGDSEVHIWF